MSAKHTISINGRAYDAVTGLPVDGSAPTPKPVVKPVQTTVKPDIHREPARHSASIHEQVHRSETLRRSHLAAPASKVTISAPKLHEVGHVQKSPMISHFASHPQPLAKNRPVKMINDIGPVARHAVVAPSTREHLPSKEVKERLIAQAGAHVDHALSAAKSPAKKPKRTSVFKRVRKHHLVAAGIATLLLAGYVTYLNVPSISVRVAAAQAGIDAKYPDYSPDGYSFQGPVAFEQGKVELQFKSNGGGEGYTIIEQNSDWNSVAVRDNLVAKVSNSEPDVYSIGGVTVYTYGTNAAWTNGGILYKIQGKAPLSSDQLRRIASSM